ncbi:transposase [Qipengyuania flava]|uniref:transposase n=1 Tax=Qipengyuania flava TaxID=192812 RepID=UPI001C6384C2|nr:transposase [Qipengyuania flava]QYJ08200.1 transposase [Qipengyuania flava]
MPRVIANRESDVASLEATIEALAAGFDPRDVGDTDRAAGVLERLANNRSFLGDLLIDQLRERHRDTFEDSAYGPQAIVLSPLVGGCFLRANIWPAESESSLRSSGADSFVYGLPHDHNFDFLTAGYFGPGYRSDYYEIDYGAIAGFRGEHAAMRFVERSALSEGKLMHYRAHVDVHSQLPPEATSVSLNIMRVDAGQDWFDQYGFDLDSSAVTGVLNPSASETFLRCAVAFGGDSALDLAEHFGRSHPSGRMRLASFEARSGLLQCTEDRDALWREAEGAGNLMLAREAQMRRAALQL